MSDEDPVRIFVEQLDFDDGDDDDDLYCGPKIPWNTTPVPSEYANPKAAGEWMVPEILEIFRKHEAENAMDQDEKSTFDDSSSDSDLEDEKEVLDQLSYDHDSRRPLPQLSALVPDLNPTMQPVPWATNNLTNLDLNYLPANQLFSLFTSTAASNLETLSIAWIEGRTEGQLPSTITFALPRLAGLSIGSVDHISNIIDRLVLPSLSHLRLLHGFGVYANAIEAWPSLYVLLSRSNCRLDAFDCGGLSAHEELLIQILRSPVMANLTHLVVASKNTDALLLVLSTEAIVLPLQSLVLQESYSGDGSITLLVYSRMSILRHVKVDLYGPEFRQDTSLRMGGIELEINHYQR